jgi:hypothetical protein
MYQIFIVWRSGDKNCADSSAFGVRAIKGPGQTKANRLMIATVKEEERAMKPQFVRRRFQRATATAIDFSPAPQSSRTIVSFLAT